jgi:hypothetical protein
MVTVFGSFGVLVSSSVQHFLWPVLQASLRLLILLVGTKHDQTKKNNKHTTRLIKLSPISLSNCSYLF